MRVAVVTGSRKSSAFQTLFNDLSAYQPSLLIHGGATGADQMAQSWADKNASTEVRVFRPRYDRLPTKVAPLARNWEMMAYASGLQDGGDKVKVFAYPIEVRGGTDDAIEAAEHYDLELCVRRESDHFGVINTDQAVRYAVSQPQTRPHTCHWPDCNEQVPPAMWGCKPHWLMLPYGLRKRLWEAYRPGQEVDMTPSDEYLRVARVINRWAHAKIAADALK